MTLEQAISMDPIKEKLRNLREHLPQQDETVYDFAAYLTDYLNPRLVPAGFHLGAMLALHDLQTGVNGFTGEAFSSRLAGSPSQLYVSLEKFIPQIAEATCPPEFAQGVREYHEQVQADVKEKRSATATAEQKADWLDVAIRRLSGPVDAGEQDLPLEVLISPLPLEGLFSAFEERRQILEPYWKADEEYCLAHPAPDFKTSSEAWKAWYDQKNAELRRDFAENLESGSRIWKTINGKKQEIFYDLASRLHGMMIVLRTCGVLAMEVQNFRRAQQIIQQHPDQEISEKMQEYASRFQQLTHEYAEAPSMDRSILEQVEKFSEEFSQQVLSPLHQYAPDVRFLYDLMHGKMSSFYFTGPEEFFKHFEFWATPNPDKPGTGIHFCGRGEDIHYAISGGLLAGNYVLTTHPGLEYKEFSYDGNYTHMNLLAPVQLRMEISESLSGLIKPTFDRIREDYASRLVSAEKLRPWKRQEDGGK